MKSTKMLSFAFAASLAAAALGAGQAQAEVHEIRISRGLGVLYMPLFVMQHEKLLEKHAAAEGLGDLTVDWKVLDGGNVINDAMMAGSLDLAGIGTQGLVTLWSKARGLPNVEVEGISGLSSTALWLYTNKPEIKSLKDFTASDKIAVPGIKSSLAAIILQMMAAKEFGEADFAKLDPLTVGMPYPDGLAAVVSGKTEVTAQLASPPFSYLAMTHPNIHRVASSTDYLGNVTLDVVFGPRRFVDANPKTVKAFVDALDEADAYIAAHKREAAQMYIDESKVKIGIDDLMQILDDPDTRFSTTPTGTMKFADFMATAGTIKARPAKWSDMFISQIGGRDGS